MRDSESSKATSEPKKERELKGHTEGSHSPFGVIWQVATATGWSVEYIMWKVNYQTLIMMTADAVRYISPKDNDKKNKKTEGSSGALGFFQSRLK